MRIGYFLELWLGGARPPRLIRDLFKLGEQDVGHVEFYPGPQKAAGLAAGEAAAAAEAGLGALG